MDDNKEEYHISISMIIESLSNYPYPIIMQVPVYSPVKAFIDSPISLGYKIKRMDAKEYAIKALKHIDDSIKDAENRAIKAEKKLQQYKDDSRKFEEFIRFAKERGL